VRRRAGFAGLMTAEAISLFGSRMTFVALPWLVLVETGSATLTGVVAFAEMLPYVVACAAGGPLIDRVGARRASIVMDGVSVGVIGAIPLLYGAGRLGFGALAALVGVAGLVRGLGDTAKRVVFPAVVERAGVDLTRATSLQDGLSRATTLIGAPLAGVLVAVTDAPTVLLIDAASFGIAAVLVAAFVPRAIASPAPTTDEGQPSGSYAGQLREGIAFVLRDRLVLAIVLMLFVTNLLDQAYGAVFVPVWAKDVFGSPVGIGLLSAGFAVGAVAGNIAYTILAPRLSRFAPFAVGFLLGGAPRFIALALDAPMWSILAVAATAGFGIAVVNPILGAVSYERIPPRLQARVLGLGQALAWAGIPIGGVLGGWLTDTAGLRTAMLAAGLVYLVATLMPFTRPYWREMDRRRVPADSNAPAPSSGAEVRGAVEVEHGPAGPLGVR
jgi:MFS family permease